MDIYSNNQPAKISITGQTPPTPSFQDFDVQFGKEPLARDASKQATFQNSYEAGGEEKGDARFMKSAGLMGGNGDEIIAATEAGRTYQEKREEANIEP